MSARILRPQDLAALAEGEHYDLVVSGLIFWVGKRRRVWVMRPRIAGRRTRVRIGFYPHMSLAKAREVARERQAQTLLGLPEVWPNKPQARPVTPSQRQAPPPPIGAMTFQQLLDDYEVAQNADPAKPAMRTMKERIRTMQRELPDCLPRPAASLTGDEIAAARNRLAKQGKRVAANRFVMQLNVILKWAKRESHIPANPMPDFAPFPEQSRDRILSPDEIRAVWAASLEADNPAQRAYGRLVRFLLLSAQRRDEAAHMPFSEIVNGVWNLPAERNKGKRLHCVPLTPRLRELLGEGDPDDHPFRTSRGVLLAGWSDLKEKIDARCGVKNWTLHDLRRTAATFLDDRKDVSGEAVERLLNHALPGVGGVYRKGQMLDEKLAALKALEAIIPPEFA